MTGPIRVLVADDHPVVRRGLMALIESEPGMEIVGEAADGEQAVAKAATAQPDVIVLDLLMPRKDGIAATTEIRAGNPDARILILTSFAEDEQVLPAVEAGASGYLLKDSSPQELLNAIRAVHSGEGYLHPSVAGKVMRRAGRPRRPAPPERDLTARELEVLRLIAQGLSNQEIARILAVSERTVAKHTSNILGKLQLANRTQAARYALREGLATLSE